MPLQNKLIALVFSKMYSYEVLHPHHNVYQTFTVDEIPLVAYLWKAIGHNEDKYLGRPSDWLNNRIINSYLYIIAFVVKTFLMGTSWKNMLRHGYLMLYLFLFFVLSSLHLTRFLKAVSIINCICPVLWTVFINTLRDDIMLRWLFLVVYIFDHQ